MTHPTIYKLYRVTFLNGRTVNYKASSPRLCALAVSCNGGSDIKAMEILAVDGQDCDGKAARKVARLAGIQTRHMNAFPAKVTARYALTPSATARLVGASNTEVVFHYGTVA